MQYSNTTIIKPIKFLKKNYKAEIESSWFKRFKLWFFPSSVIKALEQIPEDQDNIDSTQVQAIYHALMNQTWFFQRWIFSCLRVFFDNKANYFFYRNNNHILLTPEYFHLIMNHSKPYEIADALDSLISAGISTSANRAFVVAWHSNRLDNLSCLDSLLKAGILNQENFDMVKATEFPETIIWGLKYLIQAGLYTPSNRAALLNCKNPRIAADSLHSLCGVGIFAWTYMSKGILTQENFNTLVTHANIPAANAAIWELWCHGFALGKLTQANFVRALSHPNPQNLAYALHAIKNNDFPQTNLDYLFQHANILLTNAAGQLWARIPEGSFASTHFEHIKSICDDNSRTIEIRRRNFAHFINHTFLGLDNNRMSALNDNQSTHTASVHASVSQSASKLLERYGSKIMGHQLEDLCNKIKEAFSNLSDDNPHHRAAKRGIARITAPDFIFIDLDSQVSIKQLVALSWLAIHDEALRRGSLKEAQAQFVNGLYEIQRGYNLSADNIDNQQEDKPICLAGTFNKLVEKLASIHPDCEIRVVTKALATLKLPQEVKAQATRFLQQHIKLSSEKEGYSTFNALSKQIKDSGIEVIWKDIKKAVFDHMFKEFGSLYHNNKEDKEFNTLMDCGEQCDIVSSVAEVKLSLLIREEAKRYLEQCAGIKTQEGSLAFNTLIEQIMKNGGVVIWPQIKEAVTARLFEEFKMYYGNDKADKGFKSLIDNAKHGDVLKSEILAMAQQQQKLLQPNPSGFFSAANTIEKERGSLNKAESNDDRPTAS